MSFFDRYNDHLRKSMVHPTEPNMAIFCVFAYSIEYILWPQLSINPGTLDTSPLDTIPARLNAVGRSARSPL